MICVSIRENDQAATLAALAGLDFAEVRLDGFQPTRAEIEQIFSLPLRLIATMRPGGVPESTRLDLLMLAVQAGAVAVDIELEAPPETRNILIAAARASCCRVIVSHHDYQGTPGRSDLEHILDSCFESGAQIAKIACRVRTPAEAARLLGLLDDPREIVPVGMGPLGRITRIAGPLLGAPFTFAARDEGKETAEGQLPVAELSRILKGISRERG